MRVIPFEPKHLDQIKARSNGQGSDCPQTVMNTAFTFLEGEEVVAICGGFPFVPGVIHFLGLALRPRNALSYYFPQRVFKSSGLV